MGNRKTRVNELYNRIRVERHSTIASLAKYFGISTATVRRDVKELEEKNFVLQTVGGGVVFQQQEHDGAIEPRQSSQMIEQKIRIAEYCSELVREHEDILIGPGTTTFLAGKIMSGITDRTFRIITNSLELALETSTAPNIHTVMLGGEIWNKHTITQEGADILSSFHSYTAILSPDGLDLEYGATIFESRLVYLFKAMVSASSRIILAVDSSKFGKIRYHSIAPISALDIIVTDTDAPKSIVDGIRKQGVEVILV